MFMQNMSKIETPLDTHRINLSLESTEKVSSEYSLRTACFTVCYDYFFKIGMKLTNSFRENGMDKMETMYAQFRT